MSGVPQLLGGELIVVSAVLKVLGAYVLDCLQPQDKGGPFGSKINLLAVIEIIGSPQVLWNCSDRPVS